MGLYAISLNGGTSRLGERTISDWACAAGTQATEQLGLARGGDDDNVGYIYDVLRLI